MGTSSERSFSRAESQHSGFSPFEWGSSKGCPSPSASWLVWGSRCGRPRSRSMSSHKPRRCPTTTDGPGRQGTGSAAMPRHRARRGMGSPRLPQTRPWPNCRVRSLRRVRERNSEHGAAVPRRGRDRVAPRLCSSTWTPLNSFTSSARRAADIRLAAAHAICRSSVHLSAASVKALSSSGVGRGRCWRQLRL